ncbi:exopolyphosphatase/guanosine-5'-triphosphate,3'-diphosphate pyrophosphatase [Nocardioides luteus]|uniref:Hydrolase n=1 Tax=Nocardioides luteus TaxID=1844 RepID=A0ABQ5SUJ1_9ACTN|nr:Ppx/GppA phosphatase family protein [Nocardioides luteus]MDR7309294.1 exopolyphosphatase/guanosine-5'-triphosphate,3'-diphosphate pyrophosphatase [Nocardioides luteus]GGR69905.1 hydrolase [Nocardioides luteus]GLJ67700.1 hydrolase [Nocardioides luteus]
MKVAAIDCGTNTIKLLIATVTADGLTEDVREARMVRLGQGVDRTGVLADEALERAFGAIDEYAALIRDHGVERVRFVATSATRDAANAATFTDGVRARLGVDPEVVTGAEEAALSFGGAARNLRGSPQPPVLVIDIGGGSTELILGEGPTPTSSDSMDIGAVRLHERHLRSDPPTREEVEACVRDIDAHLDACPVDPVAASTVVAVGGTVIQLTMGLLELAAYDRTATDHAELSPSDIDRIVERLLAMSVEERLALPWMHPGRADVIAAGGLILGRILRRSRVETLLVSEADILDGIAWSVRD